MTDFIEFEVDEDEVMRGLTIQEVWAKHVLRDFIDDLADKGIEVLRMHAPKPGLNHPYSEGYTQEHIDRTGISWHPGGAGGGGTYQVILGVKAGTSYHPVYANLGTGVYSYTRDYIRSISGKLMWFYGTKIGLRIAAYEVAGQRPQRFLYETWRDLALFAEMRLLTERSFINSI
jgi:hypothetical protein